MWQDTEMIDALRQARAEAGRASPTPTLIAVPEPVLVAPVAAGGTLEHEPLPPEAPHEVVSGSAEEYICSFSWPCSEALYVARCESGFGRDLYNETPIYNAGVENHALGWFGMAWPLHSWRWHGTEWGVLENDTPAAYSLYAEQGGWYAWGCQP